MVSQLDTPLRLAGNPAEGSRLADLDDAPSAVLCRTNAEAMHQLMSILEQGQRVALVGGGAAIRSIAQAAADLKDGRRTSHLELYVFPTWAALQEYVETEPAGRDLKPFVDLIDAHGADVIIDAVDALVDERRARTVVSTSHKATAVLAELTTIGYTDSELDSITLLTRTQRAELFHLDAGRPRFRPLAPL